MSEERKTKTEMVDVTITIPKEVYQDFLFLGSKLVLSKKKLGRDVFRVGLKQVHRSSINRPRGKEDAASNFRRWLEFVRGYTNNSSRTISSSLRKVLEALTADDSPDGGEVTPIDLYYFAGASKHPGNAKRAVTLWLEFCDEAEQEPTSLIAA